MHNNTVYEWILHSTFTVSARSQSLYRMAPYLTPLIRPGDKVLDLCCGSGPMSFWFEDQGAKVTGIDFAPYMIALARQEASRRDSKVEFIEGDIFTYDLGQSGYDIIACFGNSISDFPLSDFMRLVKIVTNALKPGGCFVIEYQDGSYPFMQGSIVHEGVFQEVPERITFKSKGYSPETGAYVRFIRNETRGEEYERKAYIYSAPVVQVIAGITLSLERHIILREDDFLNIFIK